MAVADAPSTETKSSQAAPLWLPSLFGGIYVLAALAVVFYLIPQFWDRTLGQTITEAVGSFVNYAGLFLAQIVGAIVLGLVGSTLAGSKPPVGLRGGIFWAICVIFTVFFLARAVAMWGISWFKLPSEAGMTVFLVGLAILGFVGLRFLRGERFQNWSVWMEESGWFSTKGYKKNQGLKVRRLTILGVLLLCGSGVYTLIANQHLSGVGDWKIVTPFLPTITLMPAIEYTVPFLLGAITLWFAVRLVHMPSFADFLIATEAEMNKVSWSPRYRLVQDTIVVLVTLMLMTLFLFVVDIFWGWFLSRDLISIVPKTQYRYMVMLDKVDATKKEEIVKALSNKDLLGLPELEAKQMFDTAPGGNPETTNATPQLLGNNLTEDTANRIMKKLKEAGAEVSVSRAKAQQTNQLDW